MSHKKDKPQQPEPEHITRRQAIKRVAITSSAALASVGLGVALTTQDTRRHSAKAVSIRDHRVGVISNAAAMAIVHGTDVASITRQAIQAVGGMQAFVKKGDRVVIKPNVGWNRLPEQGANSNPEVVAEVIRQVKAAGAAKIWVTDNPVNDAERCFTRSGIAAAARQAGAEIILPDARAFREVRVDGTTLRLTEVLWPIVDADRVINVPIVKQHGLSKTTTSLKNWYGIIGGHRVRLHQDIHRSIVDLAQMVKPTLTVVDATHVLRANGPSGGSLDDVDVRNIVAASTDEVALDAFACSLLDVDPQSVGFIVEAQRRGLGRSDYKNLKLEHIGI